MAITTVDELQVVIGANSGEFQQELKKVQKQLSKFSNGFSGMSAKMATVAVAAGNIIANAFTSAFRAVSQEMDEAITRLDALNNYPRTMANLGISAEDAEKSIKILNEGILGLPTSLSQAALATQRLTATNGNIAASTDMFLALNNAILAGGASTEIQANALEQMMQAYSKGRPDAMEWRAFLTAMPAQLKQIATQMGYTSTALGGDLQKALVDGKVTMNDFMVAIMKLNREGINGLPSFAQQAKNAVAGVQTSITNLKIAIQRGMANIMQVIGQTNISGFINKIATAVDTVSYYIAGFVTLIKQAVAWLRVLFGHSAGTTNDLVKETGAAATSTGTLANNAGAAADNLDDATGSAKKLNKQLASFDEMNVLQEKEQSGGSGGAGGGAGGNAAISDYSWDANMFGDMADKVAEYASKIKAALEGMFDMEAIKAAIERFVGDLQVFLDPVLQIIKDAWNDYIKPMISWTGSELLPAVLNAIGGALALIGSVLKTYWNKYLKPFIDNFLVPIAKWTGGKVVKILNGIGDSLRAISKRQDVVDLLARAASIIGTLGTVTLAWNAAATFLSGVLGEVFNVASGLPTIFENTRLGMLGITAGSKAYMAVANPMTSLITGIKSAFSSLWAVISAHPIATIIAVIAALMLTNEEFRAALANLLKSVLEPLMMLLNSLLSVIHPILETLMNLLTTVLTPIISVVDIVATLLAQLIDFLAPILEFILQIAAGLVILPLEIIKAGIEALNFVLGGLSALLDGVFGWLKSILGISGETEAQVTSLTQTVSENTKEWDDNEDGIIDTTEALKHYNDVVLAVNNSEMALINAQEDLIDATEKLDTFVQKYGKTEDELIRLHKENKLATLGLSDDALRELQKAIIKVENAQINLEQAEQNHIQTEFAQQEMANAAWTDYNELGRKLVEIAKEQGLTSDAYKEAEGKLYEAKAAAEKYGEANMSIIDWTKMAKKAVEDMGNQVNNTANSLQNNAFSVGSNLGQGLINGANSKSGAAWNAGYGLGQSMVNGLKRGTDSHSPSKAAREIGGFVGAGLIMGLEDEEAPVERAAKSLGETITDALSPLSNFSVALPNVGLGALGLNGSSNLPETFGDDEEPVHVTVKVGEDTLVDKIVSGINDLSYLSNRAVINV